MDTAIRKVGWGSVHAWSGFEQSRKISMFRGWRDDPADLVFAWWWLL